MAQTSLYSKSNLLLLTTIVLAFAAFCVESDIYAPSLPDMVHYFGTTEAYIQHIFTANFIGLSIATLIFGPLSDSLGRKLPLCLGLGIFAASSIACLSAGTVDSLIVYRFLQGIGAGAITGIGTAMIFDVFPKETSGQLMAILNSFVTGLMGLAPLIGSWVNILFGWQMNFMIIAVMACLALFFGAFLTKESHIKENRKPFQVGGMIKQYGAFLSNLTFMSNTLMWTIMFGFLMVFTANLSLIFIDHLNVSKEIFGFYQACIMGSFFVGSLLASKCIGRYGSQTTKKIGNIFYMIGIFALIFLGLMNFPYPILLTLAMSFCALGVALSCIIYFVDSMAEFPEAQGAMSALIQGFRLIMSASMIGMSANMFTGSIKPISYMACFCAASFFVLYKLTLRAKRGQDKNVKEEPFAITL